MRAEDQQRAKRARLDEKHASKLRKRLQAGLDKLDQLGSAFVGHAVSRHGRVSLFRTPEAAAMQAQDPNLATAQARHRVSYQGSKSLGRSLFRMHEDALQARGVRLASELMRRACGSLGWLLGALGTSLSGCRVSVNSVSCEFA